MKKVVLIFIFLLLIFGISGISVLVYQKKQSMGIPENFKDKLSEAHKNILLFNYKQADKLYYLAIKQNPSNLLALEEYLAFLVSQENLARSYKIANLVLEKNPNHFLANLIKVAYLINKNRLSLAIKSIKIPAQDANSLNNTIYAILSSLDAFINHKEDQFISISSQIKEQLPDFYYNQLLLYEVLGKSYSQSLATAVETIKNYPNVDNIIIYSKLLYLKDKDKGIETFKDYLGNSFLTTKATDNYLTNFSLNDVDIPYIFSDALFRISKYIPNKLKVAYIEPDNILIAHIALMLNANNPLARMQVASYYIQIGNYNMALNNLYKIGKNTIYYRLLYPEICKILVDLGQVNKAIETLSSVYNNDSTNPEPLLELGHLYYKQSNPKDAIKYYSEALKVAQSNNQQLGEWLAYYFRGIAYNTSDNWLPAEKDLIAAMRINDSDPLLLNYLGYSWIDKGVNIQEGLSLVKKALEKDPNNPSFLDSYAWGLFKTGKYNEALKIELETKAKTPFDSTLNEHLGDIYWKLNNKEKARSYWKAALNLEGTNINKTNIENKLKGELPDYLLEPVKTS